MIDMGRMDQYDASRQADIIGWRNRLMDPNISEREKKQIENAMYSVKSQAKSPAIVKMRRELDEANRNGDRNKAERIFTEAKKIDRDFKN